MCSSDLEQYLRQGRQPVRREFFGWILELLGLRSDETVTFSAARRSDPYSEEYDKKESEQ